MEQSGLFNKSQKESFRAPSSGSHSMFSRRSSPTFGGEDDWKAGIGERNEDSRWDIRIYHPSFKELATWKMPILGIKEQVAEEILKTIAFVYAEIYYKELMPKELKEKWKEICLDSWAQGKPEISSQAHKLYKYKPEEQFAEWCAYFELRGDNIKQIDEAKYNFIKTLYSSRIDKSDTAKTAKAKLEFYSKKEDGSKTAVATVSVKDGEVLVEAQENKLKEALKEIISEAIREGKLVKKKPTCIIRPHPHLPLEEARRVLEQTLERVRRKPTDPDFLECLWEYFVWEGLERLPGYRLYPQYSEE